jgi:TPR repeat protein
MYRQGLGVASDASRAVSLYAAACDAGYVAGCTHLGTLYERGEGIVRDGPKAVALFERACRQDDALGCAMLAALYASGRHLRYPPSTPSVGPDCTA